MDPSQVADINNEMTMVRSSLRASWQDFANYCKAKMMEAAMTTNGVSSYSIGGRSVNRNLDVWERWHRYAVMQANSERGGVQQQEIAFVPRGGC